MLVSIVIVSCFNIENEIVNNKNELQIRTNSIVINSNPKHLFTDQDIIERCMEHSTRKCTSVYYSTCVLEFVFKKKKNV